MFHTIKPLFFFAKFLYIRYDKVSGYPIVKFFYPLRIRAAASTAREENMKTNRFLTAGEFAKITGTTKHTLFHYDKIGLLPPDHRADNGYRYYSPEQLETFDVICTLRELDMPLCRDQAVSGA